MEKKSRCRKEGSCTHLRGQQVKAELSPMAELGNSRKQREHTLGGGLDFKSSKSALGDILPLVRPHLLNLLK